MHFLQKVHLRGRIEELWNVPQRGLKKGIFVETKILELVMAWIIRIYIIFEENIISSSWGKTFRGQWVTNGKRMKACPLDGSWRMDSIALIFWGVFKCYLGILVFSLHFYNICSCFISPYFHGSPTGEKQFNERRTALQYMIQVWNKNPDKLETIFCSNAIFSLS